MAGADDVMRSVGELGEKGGDVVGILPGNGHQSLDAARGLADFFHKPDNLLALALCLVAVIGLYRLLRAEGIIPASRSDTGLAGSFLARRFALWLMVSVVTAAVGLALVAVLSRFF